MAHKFSTKWALFLQYYLILKQNSLYQIPLCVAVFPRFLVHQQRFRNCELSQSCWGCWRSHHSSECTRRAGWERAVGVDWVWDSVEWYFFGSVCLVRCSAKALHEKCYHKCKHEKLLLLSARQILEMGLSYCKRSFPLTGNFFSFTWAKLEASTLFILLFLLMSSQL